jgi:hypothetical protein
MSDTDSASPQATIARIAKTTVIALVALTLALLFAEFPGSGWSLSQAKFLSSGVLIALASGIAAVTLAAIGAITYLARK